MFNSGPQTSSSTFTTLTLTIRPTFGSLPLQSLLFSGQTLTNVRSDVSDASQTGNTWTLPSPSSPSHHRGRRLRCNSSRWWTTELIMWPEEIVHCSVSAEVACMQSSCWVIEYNRCSPTFLKSCILSLQSRNLNRRDWKGLWDQSWLRYRSKRKDCWL